MNVTNKFAALDDRTWFSNCQRYLSAMAYALDNPMYREIIGQPAELVYTRALWLVCHTESRTLTATWRIPHCLLEDTLRQVSDANGAITRLLDIGLFIEDPVHEGFLVTAPHDPVPQSWRA